MIDAWALYATPQAPQMAYVLYNKGYEDAAAKDSRPIFLTVDLPMKKPRPDGLASHEEDATLEAVDQQLQAALAVETPLEVGRRTSGGHRLLYYYVAGTEPAAARAIATVASKFAYALRYTWKQDPAKDGYWKTVHPDADGQRVEGDLTVLSSLAKQQDDLDAVREVQHWAYFADAAAAREFARWATKAGYAGVKMEPAQDDGRPGVTFTHRGTMRLRELTAHTLEIDHAARRLGGSYDGWETFIVHAKK